MTYQLTLDKNGDPSAIIKRINVDGSISFIPDCAENADWIAYQLWLVEEDEDGNSLNHQPDPAE